MSWDPNQPQGQPPSGPNPYDPQQQQQPPSTPQPQSPYEQPISAPQNPYAQPASAPEYAQPQQNPYAQPVGGVPFGAPGYQQAAYGFAPQAPQPLGQAIQGLPNQYLKVTTKPGAQSFAEEQGKASWGIIWLQLIALGVFGTIIGLLRTAMGTALALGAGSSSASTSIALFEGVFAGSASVAAIIGVIAGFFILVGIQYLLAKAFGGNGSFMQQGYNYLLFYVPLTAVSYVVGLIPVLGGIIGLVLWVYGIVLNVFSIQAAHRMSGGKATAVVLIPYAILFVLFFLCAILIVAVIFAGLHGATTTP